MTRRSRTAVTAATILAGLLAPTGAAQAASSSDTHVAAQWGLDQIVVEPAWARTTGGGATVAIVDSGVDLDHPDLAANVARGVTFSRCSGQQVDSLQGCGDGDWLDPSKGDTPENASSADHGTHVAGIVAAVKDNGIGVAGVAPNARLLPVKVLDNDGSGNADEIVAGIRWSTANGADVINLSLGFLSGLEAVDKYFALTALGEAIDEATAAGVVVVAAAGNDAWPLCASPATHDGAVCVTSTDYLGNPSWFSNGGIKEDLLSVAAPGGHGAVFCDLDILSTVPQEVADEGCLGIGSGYSFMAGTSMASPHVAGVAALLVDLGCSAAEVHGILTDTSRTPGVGTGVWDPQYGWGIVDADAATLAAASCSGGGGGTPPPPPAENTAPTANDDQASTRADRDVTIDVLANDVDAEGDALTVTDVSAPSSGSVVIDPAGTVTYTPDPAFVGTATFSYTVSDGEFTDTATVTVDVREVKGGGKGNKRG